MSRLRGPIFTILALIAACGGKVIVDSNSGGGDQGGDTTGSTSGTVGVAGTNPPITSGTATGTGTGVYGVGGYYGTGGAPAAGSYGSGGVYVAGGGGYYPCGPTLCPLGTQCCNPQCGICVPVGGGCPAISCGSAGSGFAGSFGAGGACGSPASCQARIPGPLNCRNETACVCNSCACQTTYCLNEQGCQQIFQCSLKLNCRGKSCYAPQTCQSVIDQFGGTSSPSMQTFMGLAQCRSNSGCDGACAPGPTDAGLGCQAPPPLIGGQCSGQYNPDGSCSEQCFDGNMNSYSAKCSGGVCQCVYDGKLLCSCFNGGGGFGGGPCGGCCPGLH